MFSYGFVPLWFQVVVCFVALIFLILPAALPYVVWKLDGMCFRERHSPNWERVWLFVEQKSNTVLCDLVHRKDKANILKISCFPGWDFFSFFYWQVDALCLCTSSCQLTRQHLFLYVRSSVVWTYFRNRTETEGPGTAGAACMEMHPEVKSIQCVIIWFEPEKTSADWSDAQNVGTIEFFNVNSVIVHMAVLWNIFENYRRRPRKGLSLFCVYTCTPEINVIDKYL